ncbi:tyrosine-type recombinase/integrase [Pengzhenrongella frigida]|uniref:Site-specific integrase n=1 Tax=Pengzhenrongella frigida TaxID=1259133 RepID=A0A4V1ZH66_9MICO|nr:histone-like nucleoid-structuring protein Lsr2 [Cellulomonas sp. HLT2-17]RYV50974.1 site-specific integrase [Cellulomonas sp. HLT2-17]
MPNRKGRRLFGSIRQEASGRWMVRVPIPDSGGKTRSIGTFATKRAAEDALAIEHGSIATGTWVDPNRGSELLGQYAATFVATNGYRERSLALNERLLAEWIDTTHFLTVGGSRHAIGLGMRSLSSLTTQDIRLWHAAVTAESRRRAVQRLERTAKHPKAVNKAVRAWAQGAGIAVAATGRIPTTVLSKWEAAGGRKALAPDIPPTAGATEAAQAYRLLHAVLARARRDGLIKENPAAIEGAGSVATLERRPASIPELRVAAGAMTARYRAAVWVAAMTSIRSGELFALRRSDWDPQRHTLRIERSVELETSDDDFGQVKASASLRTVVVPKIAATALEEHLEQFTAKAPRSLIFTTSTGGIVYPSRVGKQWARARSAAGREDLHWHDLRHTGQSLAAAAGAGIKDLQARAGHSTTTAAIRYLHQVQDSDRRVATALDELVAREDQSGEDS